MEDQEQIETSDTHEQDLVLDEELEDLPLCAQIGSILFVALKPLSAQTLAEYTKSSIEDVDNAILQLKDHFKADLNGFTLDEVVSGSYQLKTPAQARKVINRMIPPKARRLTKAAAETLAVIAYKQPVQRSEIEAIRGVDALPTLRTLLDAKLIRIVGRDSSPGQPALYGTTNTFLEKFGLNDLSQLPPVRELMEISADPGEVDEPNTDLESEVSSND